MQRSVLPVVGSVLTVAAAAAAAWYGTAWYGAAHDGSASYSKHRDQVLQAAEQGAQNLSTLDYRNVASGLKLWEDSSTGDLNKQITSGLAQFQQQVQQAQTITVAKVLDGALTQFDDRAGLASAVVALRITVTPATGAPATKTTRMLAQLTRTNAGWLLSSLGQAQVGSGS